MMGTRADFYVGRGEAADWLGSIAWDGHPSGIDNRVLNATTEEEFRDALVQFFSGRDDTTMPVQGWPWPWKDSRTSDYAYAFDAALGGVVFTEYVRAGDAKVWVRPGSKRDEDGYVTSPHLGVAVFPDMTERKNVTLGPRSGLVFVRGE